MKKLIIENKSNLYIIILGVLLLILSSILIYRRFESKNENIKEPEVLNSIGFNNLIIQEFNKNSENKNYMFSPYSLEIVLSMLRDGASEETYKELVNLVPERDIKKFFVKERINVANGLFIKEGFKVKEDYKNIVVDKYGADLMYDKFETPAIINDWAKKETFGMIPKVMNDISKDFVMALGNAVAIDVKWDNPFVCYKTKVDKFKKLDNSNVNVAMMYNSYKSSTAYYKDDEATYISIPYAIYDKDGLYSDKGTSLEFIGILPEGNVNEFIANYDFNKLNDKLDKMEEANKKLTINVELPRFKFSNDFNNLSDMLKDLGLKETLGSNPNFTKITNENVFISDFIHKTFIDLNEVGTKAAAVTLATFDKNAIETEKPKEVNVRFDKPFVYLIKDKDSNEILFFGVIYEPDHYNSITCEEE